MMQTATLRKVQEYTRRNRKYAQYPLTTRAIFKLVERFRLPVVLMKSALEAKVIRADGTVEDLGVISRRVITTVGVGFIVDAHQNLTELEALNFHEMGTATGAEAIGDTALTAVESRVAGTQSEPAANQYRSVATITATAARAVTEHGLFSASTAGTLFDRSLFTVVNLAIGDSIQFTYTLTYTAGG